jgi:UPF0716 protein FxsA
MQLGVLLVLLSLPLIELGLLIKVGQWIGFWPTILIIFGTAVAGTVVIQQQGLTAASRMMEAVRQGKPPVAAALDSSFVVLAGVLLITPGLICDTCGLLLLVPPLRAWFAQWAMRQMGVHVEVRMARHDSQDQRWQSPGQDVAEGGVVIEGEYERVDDPNPSAKPATSDPARRPSQGR